MENASKALIMAASILLAILIIGLGVTIFNKAQNSANTTDLEGAEITMFNAKFERYSDRQLGSQVKSLISFAISNASQKQDDPSQLPTVTCTGATTATGGATASNNIQTYINALSNIRNVIISTHTYTVTPIYGANGLITTINIVE